MKVTVETGELQPGSGRGNKGSRLVFAGDKWRQIDVCIHGQQLRWHCPECIEFFKWHEKPKSRQHIEVSGSAPRRQVFSKKPMPRGVLN